MTNSNSATTRSAACCSVVSVGAIVSLLVLPSLALAQSRQGDATGYSQRQAEQAGARQDRNSAAAKPGAKAAPMGGNDEGDAEAPITGGPFKVNVPGQTGAAAQPAPKSPAASSQVAPRQPSADQAPVRTVFERDRPANRAIQSPPGLVSADEAEHVSQPTETTKPASLPAAQQVPAGQSAGAAASPEAHSASGLSSTAGASADAADPTAAAAGAAAAPTAPPARTMPALPAAAAAPPVQNPSCVAGCYTPTSAQVGSQGPHRVDKAATVRGKTAALPVASAGEAVCVAGCNDGPGMRRAPAGQPAAGVAPPIRSNRPQEGTSRITILRGATRSRTYGVAQ